MLVNRRNIDRILRKYKQDIDFQQTRKMRRYPRDIQEVFGELYDEGADPEYLMARLGIVESTLDRWHRTYTLKQKSLRQEARELPLGLEDEPHELDRWVEDPPVDENEEEVEEFKQNLLEWIEDKTGTPPMLWEAPEGYRLVSVCESQMKRLMKGVVQSPVDDLLN